MEFSKPAESEPAADGSRINSSYDSQLKQGRIKVLTSGAEASAQAHEAEQALHAKDAWK
jgi:hypothetical protein